MKENKLHYYITSYFNNYLPNNLNVSKKTISSYKDTFVLLFEYCKLEYKKDINNMNLEDFTQSLIESFLLYLEEKRKNCIATRNQRLAAIHSFFKYIEYREPAQLTLCSSILSIPIKKAPTKSISYFSVEEVKILINSPNTREKQGFKEYVILLFMYETACRAQEIVDLKKRQIIIQENSYAILIGKGNKERRNPISKNLELILIKYFKSFKITDDDEYIFKNKSNHQFTTKGIEYILLKYININKIKYPNYFKEKYSNHSMRHTRAMHLLESGVNLIYIRDLLGHTSVTTTEIYAKVNPMMKQKQIIEYSKQLNVKERYNFNEKKDLLSFLKSKK